jgi:RNA polymerase sigma factor (sigma-70 family)
MTPADDPTPRGAFPTTRRSVVAAIGDPDSEVRRDATNALVTAYWRPVYGHLRYRWRMQPADAEDLTQEFFHRAAAQGFFEDYDPARARFRTFVRTCLDRFVANARRDEGRLKRGGGLAAVPLEFDEVERELAAREGPGAEDDADAWFDREWIRGIFTDAVADLRAGCRDTPREIRFVVFERYDLTPPTDADRPSYRALADELDIPVTQVTNHLAWARRELRRRVLDRVRAVAGSDAEFRTEAEELFGAGP